MCKALCSINATARWAVTGTPIQNRVGDLAALLKFIRAYPYDEAKHFNLDIGQMWKTGNIDEATKRLKRLASGLILRRSKTVIELPSRKDLKLAIDFSLTERQFYDNLKYKALANIEESFNKVDGTSSTGSYFNVIQKTNALRMVCNLGTHYDSRHNLIPADDFVGPSQPWTSIAQQFFNFELETGSMKCMFCRTSCNTDTAAIDTESHIQPLFASCRAFICSECVQQQNTKKGTSKCGHSPGHPFVSVSTSWTDIEDNGGSLRLSDAQVEISSTSQLSSKTVALITQLHRLPSNSKTSVSIAFLFFFFFFSCFRLGDFD